MDAVDRRLLYFGNETGKAYMYTGQKGNWTDESE